MNNYIDARVMMNRAYIGLASEAMKNSKKKNLNKDNAIRCCNCGRSDVTLKKIYDRRYARAERPFGHEDIYACEACLNERALQEAAKEQKKMKV